MPFVPLGQSLPAYSRAAVPPLRAVRSSLIISSRAILRDLGHHESYVARIGPRALDALDATPPGVWVPVDLARAHFVACEELGLPVATQVEIGRRLALRLHGPVLRLGLRLAGAAGATPMLLAAKAVKLWPQRNDGGDLLIVQTAAAEARIELIGYTLADIAVARTLWCGTLEANARLVMRRAQVAELPQARSSSSVAFVMSW